MPSGAPWFWLTLIDGIPSTSTMLSLIAARLVVIAEKVVMFSPEKVGVHAGG